MGNIDPLILFSMPRNFKLLGRGNGLPTSVVHIRAPLIILMITYDYVITLLKTLYVATTNHWRSWL